MGSKTKLDIHSYDRRVTRGIDRVARHHGISKENKNFILDFVNDCIAEGLSNARVDFYINRLVKIAELFKKNFDAATKSDIKMLVGKINVSDYSEITKKDYRVTIKRFFKWLKGIDEKGVYPDEVRWIPTTVKMSERKLPEDLLTRDEVEKLIDAADNIRDKALIATLYESGCRISELTNLRIRNVTFDKHGCLLLVKGKTGMRRVRIITYSNYISRWLSLHPDKDDNNAPLWVNIGTTKKIAKSRNKQTKYSWHYEMKYAGVLRVLQRISKKTGISKRVHPHLFRHSRATQLAKSLTEAQMNQFFGWTQSSKMASTYVHLSGRDVDGALLKLNGLEVEEDVNDEPMPKRCPRCGEINPPNFRFCGNCSMALDLKTAVEADEKMKVAMEALCGTFAGQDMDSALDDYVRKKIESYLKENGFSHKRSS